MATIEKRERKSGMVYMADVRIHGFPRQKKTFRRLTDAKIWAQQTEAAIRRGEFRNVIKTAKNKTFKDVIARYRGDVEIHKAKSTQVSDKSLLKYWENVLGEYSLSYIDAELINEKLKELASTNMRRPKKAKHVAKPPVLRSRKTIKNYRDLLATMFRHAKSWGWLASNPMEDVSPIKNIRNERTRYLDDDEREALLQACKESPNEQLYPIVVFALSTGARKGEILSLTLNDVDLNLNRAVFRNTKNGDTRIAPVVGYLKKVLSSHIRDMKARYANLDEAPPKYWVFPRRDYLKPIDITKAWVNARSAANIIDFRFHDLRHCTASYLAMSGATQLEIAEVLGHRTLQMVRRYAHLSESHIEGLARELSENIF